MGNRTSKNVGDHIENYGYDDLDRLIGVSRTGVGENQGRFGYDAVGNRTSTQVGTGEMVTPTFNNRNQMLQQTVGGALVVEGTLNEEASVNVNGSPARMVTPTRFEAKVDSVPGTNTLTVAATDLSGNVKTEEYEVEVSGTAASYGYDAAGNLTSKSLPGETWTYSWNALNQLVSVSRNGALEASFQYDPLGRRVLKSTPTKATTYTYDGMDILRENVRVGGITTTSYYVHGPNIDEPLAKETAGLITYYHADGLGSIVKETSAAGAVTASLRYDAWGNIEAGARDGFAFTGREWDPETGLYYYRARYYDPRAANFISEDPIGFGGGPNLYAYVGGGPTTFGDPMGLQKVVIGIELPASNAVSNGTLNPKTDPGHTYALVVDSNGTIKKLYSFGPARPISVDGDKEFASGNLPGRTDWALRGMALEYGWDLTAAQYKKCLAAFDFEIANPRNYTPGNQCTSAAAALARSCGASVPLGRGTVETGVFDLSLENPYALNLAIQRTGVPGKLVNTKTRPRPR